MGFPPGDWANLADNLSLAMVKTGLQDNTNPYSKYKYYPILYRNSQNVNCNNNPLAGWPLTHTIGPLSSTAISIHIQSSYRNTSKLAKVA